MSAFLVTVEIWNEWRLLRRYTMDHNSAEQRRVLGEQCRNAFEGGQRVVTYPSGKAL